MKNTALKREERKRQVVLQFAVWIQNDHAERWANSYQLARSLEISPSSHFRSILAEMVQSGHLVARTVDKPGRWQSVEYMLAPGTYTPPKKRTVTLNLGNKISEQLEMFS